MNPDEIWSVWQTFGTPAEIIRWTPYDWPPGYYLALGAWRSVAGSYPAVLRAFSALVFMTGAAFMFRVMRRLRGFEAGVLATLAYAALGFGILLSLEVRGYALLLALLPLALWLTVRYFDHPGWWRALPLGVALAAMFYVSLTSFGAFVMLGLLTLLVWRGRAIWRWWLPGGIAGVLALPEIIGKARIATVRVEATATLDPGPLADALLQLFKDYAGLSFVLWVLLFVVATGLIVYHERRVHGWTAALVIWAVVMPLVMYLTNPVLGFFSPRYAWWVMPGIALWAGWGLAYLPRAGVMVAGFVLVGMLFYPLRDDGQYQIWDRLSPLGENFEWLRDHIQWGDVILNNPANDCGRSEEWDYYLRTYFPQGLHFVDDPGAYRRVWALNPNKLDEDVLVNRVPGRFVGPPGCLMRLYEAPPDAAGVVFENGMRFHGVDIMRDGKLHSGPAVYHEGETVRLRLWWSADEVLPLDYSVGTYLAKGTTILDQVDGPPAAYYPADAPPETSRWLPGQLYVEERALNLPFPAYGNYTLNLVVYFWADGVPVAAPGVNENGHLLLGRVAVKGY